MTLPDRKVRLSLYSEIIFDKSQDRSLYAIPLPEGRERKFFGHAVFSEADAEAFYWIALQLSLLPPIAMESTNRCTTILVESLLRGTPTDLPA